MKKFRLLSAILLLWSMLVYVGCRKDTLTAPQDDAAIQNARPQKLPAPASNNLASGNGVTLNHFQSSGHQLQAVDLNDDATDTPVDLGVPEEEGPEEATTDDKLRDRLTDAAQIDKSYIDFSVPTRLYWIAEGVDIYGQYVRWALPIKFVNGIIIIRVCVIIYRIVCYDVIFCRFIRDPWTGRIIGISCVPGVICRFYWVRICWTVVIVFNNNPLTPQSEAQRPAAVLPKRE